MIRWRSPIPFGFLMLVAGCMLLARDVQAAPAPAVDLRGVSLTEDGTVRLVLAVPGQTVERERIAISENGAPIPSFELTALDGEQERVTVALAIDVSGSTVGRPLADAKRAARRFVSLLPANIQVSLTSFGPRVHRLVGATGNRARILAAIDRLRAAGGTALYDGIRTAAASLRGIPGQHVLVVFSDGKDTASRASLAQAVAGARAIRASVTSVALVTPDFDSRALSRLASSTRGRVLKVGQSRNLADAFGEVAEDISSQWVLTFASNARTERELEYTVAVSGIGSATISTLNTARPGREATATHPSRAPAPPVRSLSSSAAFALGVAAAALAFLLLAAVLLSARNASAGDRALRRLRTHTRPHEEETEEKSTTSLLKRLVALLERLPAGDGTAKLQLSLDRAGWLLRVSEFRAMQIGTATFGALTGGLLFGRPHLAVILAGLGWFIPRALLTNRIEKRKTRFLGQLPDTLQLLAGSLKAGYAFMQALDTLVREASQPTSDEFKRVLTEARLGMAVENAMSQMADRIDSDDFRWVVLAINIQRQVGGNLAELLETVAETLRSREQVRRQIKVLSAEGRLSAVILTGLPFLLAAYMAMVNPTYMKPLFTETVGRVMLGSALSLMGFGVLWMRKLIRIDV